MRYDFGSILRKQYDFIESLPDNSKALHRAADAALDVLDLSEERRALLKEQHRGALESGMTDEMRR